MNKILRVGTQTAFSFGVAAGLFSYFSTGRLTSVLVGAGCGILFGAGMAWVSFIGDRRLEAKGIHATDLNPVQVRRVSYPGSPEDAMEVARQAIQKLRKLKKVTETGRPPSLRARTGANFESFGEDVVIDLAHGEAGTTMEVSSRPRLSTTEMDMGRGVENVETVVQYLVEKGARRVA